VGCGKEDREDTRELRTGVGIDPREWKKSPRKMQPGVVPAGEEEQRERRRSIVARHAGRVWVLTWRSENTYHLSTLANGLSSGQGTIGKGAVVDCDEDEVENIAVVVLRDVKHPRQVLDLISAIEICALALTGDNRADTACFMNR